MLLENLLYLYDVCFYQNFTGHIFLAHTDSSLPAHWKNTTYHFVSSPCDKTPHPWLPFLSLVHIKLIYHVAKTKCLLQIKASVIGSIPPPLLSFPLTVCDSQMWFCLSYMCIACHGLTTGFFDLGCHWTMYHCMAWFAKLFIQPERKSVTTAEIGRTGGKRSQYIMYNDKSSVSAFMRAFSSINFLCFFLWQELHIFKQNDWLSKSFFIFWWKQKQNKYL
jgi:hypothetical protein